MFWRDHNVPPLINQDEYDQASSPVEKADILRLEIIMLCGGLYIDTDFECLKPIDPLFEGKERLFFKESAERVCNGIFAACPGDPVVTSLVKGLAKRKETHGHEKLDKRYGPGYITQVVGLSNATDPKYAFPYGLNEKHRKNEDFKTTSPEAYAAHHWAGSWLK